MQFDGSNYPFPEIDADLNHFMNIYPDLFNEDRSHYYDIDKFNSLECDPSFDLSVIHVNARSMSANFDQFYALFDLLRLKFDIICVSETWLDESVGHLFNFEGYNAFHSHRSTRGGGSSIYVRDIHHCNIIEPNFSVQFANSVVLQIRSKSKSVIVSTFYRSQKADSLVFIEGFIDVMTRLNRMKSDEVIVCGDFYFDLLKLESCNVSLDFFNAVN